MLYSVMIKMCIFASSAQEFDKTTENMKRQIEAERTKVEDKLRIAAKLMVLKERESWAKERQQLLDKTKKMQAVTHWRGASCL